MLKEICLQNEHFMNRQLASIYIKTRRNNKPDTIAVVPKKM